MNKIKTLVACLAIVFSLLAPLVSVNQASAAAIAGETFTGISSQANQWLSGGTGSGACLTAATSSAANSVPACSGGPLDSVGSGALRLTNNTNNQSGFAIYNTPVSASEGLNIDFDMFQYGGTGADGIAFFLIDGAASPTQPGAVGGSLGYSNNTGNSQPGIIGGYVGIGFDRFGNFSNAGYGTGGPGRIANSITVRGNEASGYQFVSTNPANAALAIEATATRTSAKRHVRVTISTANIMNVAVNYFDGNGLQTEITNINLNTINGSGSLPANFKFGFAASTGGQNNYHEISGLSVNPLRSDVRIAATHSSGFKQAEVGTVNLAVSNDSGAEVTTGLITVTNTLPAGLTPTSASGTGWSCSVVGQLVTCTRPGDGANALAPGASAPAITVGVNIGATAAASVDNTATVTAPDNINASATSTDTIAITASADNDGASDSIETAAPNTGDANNDGTLDKSQAKVTSFVSPVSGDYAVLENSGCTSNSGVSIFAESANASADGEYSYPAGLMDFNLICGAPGDTATVTQYYYGSYDAAKMVMRKYNATTQVYRDVPGAVITNVTIGGLPALKIVYQVTDGSSFDDDGLANGIIVDPAGPALSTAVITAPAATVGAPDTGLAYQSPVVYYAAGLAGAALIAYEAKRRSRNFSFAKIVARRK